MTHPTPPQRHIPGFHLAEDPAEKNNLAAKHPEKLEQLAAELQQIRDKK